MAVEEEGPDYVTDKIIGILFEKELKDHQLIQLPDSVVDEYVGVYEKGPIQMIVTRVNNGLKLDIKNSGEIVVKSVEKDLFKTGARSTMSFIFHRSADGKIQEMVWDKNAGPEDSFLRTNKPLPETRKSIILDPAKLEKFSGKYEMAPGMAMEIFSGRQ